VLVALTIAALLAPVAVLIHELGHATVGLVGTEGLVSVRVGRTPSLWRVRVGRLRLALHVLPARNEPAGLAAVYGSWGRPGQVAFALAGPVAECSAGLLLLAAGRHAGSTTVDFVAAAIVGDALLNLVPHQKHRRRSDGLLVLDALRGTERRPETERPLRDAYGRWLALFTNPPDELRTSRQAEWLHGAADTLGCQGADRLTAARLALAGWCWRAAERDDPTRLREAALDAAFAATRTGAIEPHLTRSAAHALTTRSDLLLTGAPSFARVADTLRVTTLQPEQQRFAFDYGAALYEIQRVRS
jgi:hypothetical protein